MNRQAEGQTDLFSEAPRPEIEKKMKLDKHQKENIR